MALEVSIPLAHGYMLAYNWLLLLAVSHIVNIIKLDFIRSFYTIVHVISYVFCRLFTRGIYLLDCF